MNHFRIKTLITVLLPIQVSLAVEPSSKALTAGDFVLQMVADAPQVYATVCSAKNPSMKVEFDKAIANYQAKVERIGSPLLSLEIFASLKNVPPPQEAIDAIPAQDRARMEQIKDADPAKDCPVFLANIQNADSELLKVGISHSLTGMQGLIAGKKAGVFK